MKRTLYFGNPAYLSLRNGQLVLRLPEVAGNKQLSAPVRQLGERTFPIEDLGIVMLDHQQITVTQALLASLLEAGCALITCNSQHMPAGMLLSLNANTLQSQRFRVQLEASKPLKKQLWQQTVSAKIANQAAVLKGCVPACEVGNMRAWATAVKSDDADNREGRAAAYYWRNLFPRINGFVRDRNGEPPNNLLNYGYAILRAMVARSLVAAGLHPTLGIHHHGKYDAYCLANDMMEPYRPVVDRLVCSLLGGESSDEGLSTAVKRQFLSLPTAEVRIDGHRSPLAAAIDVTTASLLRCMSGEARKLSYPEL